jgi:hypothetical protein
MSSNLSIRFIHPDANGRGREPLEEVLAHGTEKLAFACAFMTDAKVILRGQAVPTQSLNQKPHLSCQFWFSTPKVRPDPVFGPKGTA